MGDVIIKRTFGSIGNINVKRISISLKDSLNDNLSVKYSIVKTQLKTSAVHLKWSNPLIYLSKLFLSIQNSF